MRDRAEQSVASEPSVIQELLAREPLLHRLAPGADRALISALLDPEFTEIGASGRVYDRPYVLDVVEERYATGVDPDDSAWTIDEVVLRCLAEDLYLLTYALEIRGRRSRRSTLWRRQGSDWRAVHHQGTPRES